jgi:hypothetical protein
MGAEIIFGVLLAIMFTVIGSATVYQAVISKEQKVENGQVVLKRLTAPLMLQLILGCIYIAIGLGVFGVTIPVAQGQNLKIQGY